MGEIKFTLYKDGPSLYKITFSSPENIININVDLSQHKLFISHMRTNSDNTQSRQSLTWDLSGNFSLESSEPLPNLERVLTRPEAGELGNKTTCGKLPYFQALLEIAKRKSHFEKEELLAKASKLGQKVWIARILNELKRDGIIREVDAGVYRVEKLEDLENLCRYGSRIPPQ